MVLVCFGVTGSEVMFLCLHTFLFYSILMVTVVHLLNIRSRQHSAQLIKDFYLESRRFVMVRDSAYVVPSVPHENLKRIVHLKNLNIA